MHLVDTYDASIAITLSGHWNASDGMVANQARADFRRSTIASSIGDVELALHSPHYFSEFVARQLSDRFVDFASEHGPAIAQLLHGRLANLPLHLFRNGLPADSMVLVTRCLHDGSQPFDMRNRLFVLADGRGRPGAVSGFHEEYGRDQRYRTDRASCHVGDSLASSMKSIVASFCCREWHQLHTGKK